MSLKPAIKLYLFFVFSIFFLFSLISLNNPSEVSAEIVCGSEAQWYSRNNLCDITLCGSCCPCGYADYQGTIAICNRELIPGIGYWYTCDKDPYEGTHFRCCPENAVGPCKPMDPEDIYEDCVIEQPNPPYSDGSCYVTRTTKPISCSSVSYPAICYTSGTSCAAQGGTCGNPSNCNGTLQTGLCPGGSDCVCCIPLPDCGHTCLNDGTASVGWPDCSCTNQPPASGYEKIGTWNSSDCPSCTGYRQVGCSCSGWVAGSCEVGTVYLRPGICDSGGCSVDGRYKICCKDDRSGATCQYY